EQGAPHFLQEIVIFVSRFGTTIDGHGVGAIPFVDLDQLIGGDIQGGVPVGLDPIPVVGDLRMGDWAAICTNGEDLFPALGFGPSFEEISAHKRSRNTFGMIDEIIDKTSLNAEITVIDRRVKRRSDSVNKVILDVQL